MRNHMMKRITKTWIDENGVKRRTVVERTTTGGHIPKNTVYLSLYDSLLCQSDDDGDQAAITPDPRILRLFSNRIDRNIYQIEPDGAKFAMKTDSPEGMEYIRNEQMGPVGITTMYRAKLLAVHDVMGALAMAVLTQEAIDSAKRKVIWSDWTKATNLKNWKVIDGVHYLHYEGSQNFLRDRCGSEIKTVIPTRKGKKMTIKEPTDGEMPLRAISVWVQERLRQFGVDKGADGEKQNPLGWRVQHAYRGSDVLELNKRISNENWEYTVEKQNGYNGGNLVHVVHDHALDRWKDLFRQFEGEGTGDIRELMLLLLKKSNVQVRTPDMPWLKYLEYRKDSGLQEFSASMQKAMAQDAVSSDGSENSQRYKDIDAAYAQLRIDLESFSSEYGLQGLLTIWYMETTDRWRVSSDDGAWYTTDIQEIPHGAQFTQVNKPNHAINAVAWPGSPVLSILGIHTELECDYLTPERIKKIVEVGLTKENSLKWLSERIWSNEHEAKGRTHLKVHGIPLSECQVCKDKLQSAMVRGIRASSRRSESKFIGRMVGALNKMGKYSGRGGFQELGVDVRAIMQMSEEELEVMLDTLDGDQTRKGRATKKLIQSQMS